MKIKYTKIPVAALSDDEILVLIIALAGLCLLLVLYLKNKYGYRIKKRKLYTIYPNQSLLYIGYSKVLHLPPGLPQGTEICIKERLDDNDVLYQIDTYLSGGNRLKPSLIGNPRIKEVRRVSYLLSRIHDQLRRTASNKSTYELKNIDDVLKQIIKSADVQDFYSSIKLAEHASELSKR
jgi:hypothetical protein